MSYLLWPLLLGSSIAVTAFGETLEVQKRMFLLAS